MARYIDADKAKRAVFWDEDAIEAIDQVPTVYMESDDYCSHGERREDDGMGSRSE